MSNVVNRINRRIQRTRKTYVEDIQFSKAFWITAGARGIKTLIAIPIEIAVIILFEKTIICRLDKILKRRR